MKPAKPAKLYHRLSETFRLLNERKEEIIAKEKFTPVIRKFQKIQIQPHYKNECWSIDLIDRSSLSKYNKKLQVYSHNN